MKVDNSVDTILREHFCEEFLNSYQDFHRQAHPLTIVFSNQTLSILIVVNFLLSFGTLVLAISFICAQTLNGRGARRRQSRSNSNRSADHKPRRRGGGESRSVARGSTQRTAGTRRLAHSDVITDVVEEARGTREDFNLGAPHDPWFTSPSSFSSISRGDEPFVSRGDERVCADTESAPL